VDAFGKNRFGEGAEIFSREIKIAPPKHVDGGVIGSFRGDGKVEMITDKCFIFVRVIKAILNDDSGDARFVQGAGGPDFPDGAVGGHAGIEYWLV
jgi:hypothetical protein